MNDDYVKMRTGWLACVAQWLAPVLALLRTRFRSSHLEGLCRIQNDGESNQGASIS